MTKVSRTSPWVIGHRGASGYRPEHTALAYELAIAQGADAVEPDVVPTKDGVLVIRHESEISGTTDVAAHPEFVDRRTTKEVDGVFVTGWFTEDFTWEELQTLTCSERLPDLRPDNTLYDGRLRMMSLPQLLDLLEAHNASVTRPVGVVVEIKHPTHFAELGFDLAELVRRDLRGRPWGPGGFPLVVESFERTVLYALQDLGLEAEYVYLLERRGVAPDDRKAEGDEAKDYPAFLKRKRLRMLAERLDGISPDRRLLIPIVGGVAGTPTKAVAKAREFDLSVYTWTLRAESKFLPRPLRKKNPGKIGEWRPYYASLLDLGLDGVFADQPDLARLAVTEAGRRL